MNVGLRARARSMVASAKSGMVGPVAILLFAAAALAAIPAFRIPGPDLDSSWVVGISTAISQGMSFGQEVVFTYGPWANLDLLSVFTFGQVVIALLLWAATGVAFVLIAWNVVRAWLSPVAAAMLIAVVAAPALSVPHVQSGFSGRVLLITLMLALAFAAGNTALRLSPAWLVVLTAAASLAVQVKFSNGVLALATVGLIAALIPGRDLLTRLRSIAVVAVTAVVATVLAWLLGGQSLSAFPNWVRGSLELTSGYSEAMAIIDGGGGHLVLLAVAVAVVIAALILRSRNEGWNWVLVGLVAWAGFLGVRLGFTRQDDVHVGQTFLILTVVLLVIGIPHLPWASAGAVAVSASVVFALWSAPYFTLVDPGLWAKRVLASGSAVISSSERARLAGTGAAELREFFDLPASIERNLQGKSVHIDPFDTSVAWAYGLDWRPVPVFQSYSAYTPYLDGLNATALRSDGGPDAILRAAHGTIDGRNVLWEAPQYTLELFCNFTPGVGSDEWMVLDRIKPRCADSIELESIDFVEGESIVVPSAPNENSLVVASFTLDDSLVNRAARTLFKQFGHVVIGTPDGQFRLPIAHSGGPLIVSIPEPADWPEDFGGMTDFSNLTVSESGSVTFFAIELE